jgi:hypothetical protein
MLKTEAPSTVAGTPPTPPDTGVPGGGTSETPGEESPRLFFSKPDAPAPETPPEDVDASKLPPELKSLWDKHYKSMQADYTRKTQAVADQRREILEERERFLSRWEASVADRRPRAETPEQPASTLTDQIRVLREEGRHDEADALLMQAAEKMVEPVKAEAEVARRQATFQNIVAEVRNTDPIVQTYFKDVAAIWDAPNPAVQVIREAVLKSPDTMKVLPTVFNIIARAVHAEKMEAELEKRIKTERKSAVDAEKKRAAATPGSLIDAGGRTKDSASPKMNIREAAIAAVRSSVGAA